MLERAGAYAVALLHGDMGRSFRTGQPVLDMLMSQLPYTLILIAASMLVAILIGIPLGLVAALKRNSFVDSTAMTAAVLGASIPQYWLGLVMILVVAVNLRWLPATGSEGIQTLILPALALGIAEMAIIARLTRSEMVEVLQSDYVRTAEAKGLGRRAVVMGHAFRNSLIPIVTMLGLQVGALLGGAVVIEVVFARPGPGHDRRPVDPQARHPGHPGRDPADRRDLRHRQPRGRRVVQLPGSADPGRRHLRWRQRSWRSTVPRPG